MWHRFTTRARLAVLHAQKAAQGVGDTEVSTEHLLLAVAVDVDSMAAKTLRALDVDYAHIQAEVERQLPTLEKKHSTNMTLAPSAKHAIDLAYDESRYLDNDYIGTEHLLLGLIRQAESSLVGRLLAREGLDVEKTRMVVARLQSSDGTRRKPQNRVRPRRKSIFGTSVKKIKLSACAQRGVDIAFQRARFAKQTLITSTDLFICLCEMEGIPNDALSQLGIDLKELRRITTELQTAKQEG